MERSAFGANGGALRDVSHLCSTHYGPKSNRALGLRTRTSSGLAVPGAAFSKNFESPAVEIVVNPGVSERSSQADPRLRSVLAVEDRL